MSQATFAEGAAPSTPASGKVTLYAKTDGLLYAKDDAGTEYPVSNVLGTNVAAFLATPSSANLAAALTDEITPTSGKVLFGTAPTTFPPVLRDAPTGTAATASGSYGEVSYSGPFMDIAIALTGVNTAGLTAGNTVHITGLPTAIVTGSISRAYGFVAIDTAALDSAAIQAYGANGNTYLTIVEQQTSGQTFVTVDDLTSGSTNIFITMHCRWM